MLVHPVGVLKAEAGTVGKGLALRVLLSVIVIVGLRVREVLVHPVGVLNPDAGMVRGGLTLRDLVSDVVIVGLLDRDRDMVLVGDIVLLGEIVLHDDIVLVTLMVCVILPTRLVERVIVCEKEFVGETVGVPP